MKKRILVVDDEEDICEILQFNLESEGFEIDTAYSAEEALKKPLEKYDLILLDIMMGKMSGFRLAEKLRKVKQISVPIIFLTAKVTENDKLTGFNLGADDYITKPFSIREVIARIKAVIKRSSEKTKEEQIINVDELELDIGKKRLLIDNQIINLTRKEFEILQLLIQNQDKIFLRSEILNRVWKNEVIVIERAVDVHITRLRKKLGKYGKHIVSRSGYGYTFEG